MSKINTPKNKLALALAETVEAEEYAQLDYEIAPTADALIVWQAAKDAAAVARAAIAKIENVEETESEFLGENKMEKFIIKDWAGNTCFKGKRFKTFEDAWGYINEIYGHLCEEEFEEHVQEYFVEAC